MLKLRKILLYNYPYYLIFIIVLIISLIRLNIPKVSQYDNNTKQVIGTIIAIKEKDKVSISEIEMLVYNKLISKKQKLTAKSYEDYRAVREYQR